MSYTLDDSIKVIDGKTYFRKERLQDIANESDLEQCYLSYEEYLEADKIEEIEKTIEDTGRWSVHYSLIFKLGDKFYETYYSLGATEMQDITPYEDEVEWVKVKEVKPVEVKSIKYVEVV